MPGDKSGPRTSGVPAGLVQELALVCLVMLGCLLTGCDYNSNPVEPTATIPTLPSPTQPIIRITRREFDALNAKWQALGVQEYIMRVDFAAHSPYMGKWTLHVRVEDGKSKVVDYVKEALPTEVPSTPIDPAELARIEAGWRESLGNITIESMLQFVEESFNEDGENYCIKVSIDPGTGALLYVGYNSISEPWWWTVNELTILKQLAP